MKPPPPSRVHPVVKALYPLPPGLVNRILERLPSRELAPRRRTLVARFAAAAAAFTVAWLALPGAAPALADSPTVGISDVASPLTLHPPAVLAELLAIDARLLGGAGLLLLAVGPVFARKRAT